MELLTLTATKEKATMGNWKGYETTSLRDGNGNLVAVYPPEQKQPRRGQKTIIHNCFRYNLIWK